MQYAPERKVLQTEKGNGLMWIAVLVSSLSHDSKVGTSMSHALDLWTSGIDRFLRAGLKAVSQNTRLHLSAGLYCFPERRLSEGC